MSFVPEAQIIVINAALLLLAYVVIYPSIRDLGIGTMVAIDLAVSGVSLLIAGYLFYGTGTRFSMILFSTNWAIFSIVSMAVMEMPLFRWFCQDRGMMPFEGDED